MSQVKRIGNLPVFVGVFRRPLRLPFVKIQPRQIKRRTPFAFPKVKSDGLYIKNMRAIIWGIKRLQSKAFKALNINEEDFLAGDDKYQNEAFEAEMKARGMKNVTASNEVTEIQLLNTYMYNSPSYKRYENVVKKLENIKDREQVLTEKIKFYISEGKEEIKGLLNNDEITLEYLQNFDPTTPEELSFIFQKQFEIKVGIVSLQRPYKCLTQLDKILQKFNTESDLLKCTAAQYKEIFELSLRIEDLMLNNSLRIISGRALHKLGKLDDLSLDRQFNFVQSLLQNGEYDDAQVIIERKNVERPMWYHLKTLHAIQVGNLVAAENFIAKMKKLFKVQFVQNDVYVSLIKRYSFGANYERAEHWRKEYERCIEHRGFLPGKHIRAKFHDVPPKEKCEFLDKFHPVTGMNYLLVISFYTAIPELNNKVPEMIEFYLKQANTKTKDLEEVLLSFRFEMSTKIKPNLKKLKDKEAEKYLVEFVENYQRDHPIAAQQEEFLNHFLEELAELGGFKSITKVIEILISQKQKPTAIHFNSLLKALLKRGKVEQAFRILDALENSHLSLLEQRSAEQLQGTLEDQLIPPVNPHHYSSFLKFFSKTNDFEGFNNIVQRFKEIHSVYNTIFLTQILNTLHKAGKTEEAFKFIEKILIDNIHLQDPAPPALGYLKLYTAIWRIIKDLSYSKDEVLKSKIEIPDVRFVFLRMIHDNVIPSSSLYHTIISVFLREKDYYGAICVIQFMGKIHRTLPHEYTMRTIKKLCKFVKFNDAAKKHLPKMDTGKRYEIEHNTNKYTESFEIIKQLTDFKVTLDPFASIDEIKANFLIEREKMGKNTETNDPADTVWKILLYQMMQIVKCQEAFDPEDLIKVHDDFGLDYEADKIFKEQAELKELKDKMKAEKKRELTEGLDMKKVEEMIMQQQSLFEYQSKVTEMARIEREKEQARLEELKKEQI